jgi:hypothetical protein
MKLGLPRILVFTVVGGAALAGLAVACDEGGSERAFCGVASDGPADAAPPGTIDAGPCPEHVDEQGECPPGCEVEPPLG